MDNTVQQAVRWFEAAADPAQILLLFLVCAALIRLEHRMATLEHRMAQILADHRRIVGCERRGHESHKETYGAVRLSQ